MAKAKNSTKSEKKEITVAKYPNHEMAFVIVDGETVFTGNYWDFNASSGSGKVAGFDLNGLWDRGVESLASALKLKMQEKGYEVSVTSKKLSDQEYKDLGFHP